MSKSQDEREEGMSEQVEWPPKPQPQTEPQGEGDTGGVTPDPPKKPGVTPDPVPGQG